MVFNARGRNIVLSQEKINKMFEEINTVDAAERLMEEEYLYKEYPHHLCNAVIRENSVEEINKASLLVKNLYKGDYVAIELD